MPIDIQAVFEDSHTQFSAQGCQNWNFIIIMDPKNNFLFYENFLLISQKNDFV